MLSFTSLASPAAALGRAPLVVLHGLFGSGRNFASVMAPVAKKRPVILADLVNHGASPHRADSEYAAGLSEYRGEYGISKATCRERIDRGESGESHHVHYMPGPERNRRGGGGRVAFCM